MKSFKVLLLVGLIIGAMGIMSIASTFSIYDWWTAGGEAQAIASVLNMYHQAYPDVTIVQNPVAGGAGVNMQAVIKSLIFAGVPPTTFQVHAGWEMYQYTSANLLQPITNLWQSEGWTSTSVFPERIQQLCSYKGQYYSVPIDVGRANMVWYNKAIFDKLGLTMPTTFQGFIDMLPVIKAAGYTPIALGDSGNWTTAMLFDSTLLAVGGPKFFDQFFSGQIDASNPVVEKAIGYFKTELQYVNSNHASLTWDQACGLLVSGQAAMNIMGDWANGYFKAAGWTPDVNYGGVAVPGTEGVYNLVIDSFELPVGAPDPQNGINWLKLIGSAQAQITFNQIKGSIPARIDVSSAGFDPISAANMTALKKDVLVSSVANGSEVPIAFETDWENALTVIEYHPNMSIQACVNLMNSIIKQDLTPENLAH
ncbi:ABC transporter substrate-binding protein [Athalassotoga sp.]|uniref:ABC transporter substrate-binding protein n=1 Tax=Athalassotoga sp. TaxID=2022597 RepID=UPI003D03579D